ncbi:MAG: SDR family oxidoreductase [Smithella sp.]
MKTLFITGGSKGIGAAIANQFKNKGYKVIMPSRQEMNLLSPESIAEYFKKNNMVVDCLVNNAGINPLAEIQKIKDSDLIDTIHVNLIAPLLITRALVGGMKKKGRGRIINIGSIWGIVSKEKRSVYSMTKNGIHGLTNALAVELGKHNILVNTVCPGYTNTELTKKNVPVREARKIFRDIPLGRFAEPKEIATLVYFLGSEKNTYITGQKFIIDGGFTVK